MVRNLVLSAVSLCALSLAAAAGCATTVEDPSSSSAETERETSREGDEEVSADELALGDANRAGFAEPTYDEAERAAVLAKYTHIDPEDVVPQLLQENALQYYHFNKARLENSAYVTIVDMSIHSGTPRFFLIDMQSGAVTSTVVAHGEGSDPEDDGIPSTFGNVNDSLMTSLGYYKTAETYTGRWGFSLRLDGLSTTNSIVRERAVVMHGASYVSRTKAKQGLSWGCPALPMNEKDAIIRKLRSGSLLYIDSTPLAAERLQADADAGGPASPDAGL